MRVWTEKRFDAEVRPAIITQVRIAEAYRWLSEFDDVLNPLWEYLKGDKSIERCRDEMRTAFSADAEKIAPGLLETKAKLEQTQAALRALRWGVESADAALEKRGTQS